MDQDRGREIVFELALQDRGAEIFGDGVEALGIREVAEGVGDFLAEELVEDFAVLDPVAHAHDAVALLLAWVERLVAHGEERVVGDGGLGVVEKIGEGFAGEAVEGWWE